ncbi:MAG: RluA family pseudouridine synthase [Planctomycetota bacterium]|nr:RluA family pseudouridine synthase [Planctomycetota bacterium]
MTDDPEDDVPPLVALGGKVDRDALLARHDRMAEGDLPEDAATARFVVGASVVKRLDRYLTDRIPFLSRTSLQRLIGEGAVTVGGRVAKASTRLRAGDEVAAALPPPPTKVLEPEEIPIDILFEDEHLLVLDKQPDIIVHPARGNSGGTLVNALAWHFQAQGAGGLSTVGEEDARPGIVHRLDRFTSGVMVVAKSDLAHWRLAKQFERRRVRKRYLALVHGRPEPAADVIDLPLGKHPTHREKYAVRHDASGKASTTIYRTVATWPGFALLELDLRTGRTHQIRVHLSHRGWSIVGDDMYGGRHLPLGDLPASAADPGEDPARPLIARQALHATYLAFEHPMSGEACVFQAPLRDDMTETIERLGRSVKDLPGSWGRFRWEGCLVSPDSIGLPAE